MKRWYYWFLSWAMMGAIAVSLLSYAHPGLVPPMAYLVSPVLAQSPSPSLTEPPPNPTNASPSPIPSLQIPTATDSLPKPPALPASTAPPLPLEGAYQDPENRFRLGMIRGSRVTPLAGSVLIESLDGNLAYSAIIQAQPSGARPVSNDPETVLRVATTVFQRGEGFQPGQVRPEAGGGSVVDWTGSLTIAGQTQPIGGVILIRQSASNVLLLLIAATQKGRDRVPGALAALANTLQLF